jgi:hypothetical protein
MGWMIGVLRFDPWRELGIFLFTTVSRMALGPANVLSNGHQGLCLWGIKRPGREADHSPPSTAEVKKRVQLYLHSPNTPSQRGAQLKAKV